MASPNRLNFESMRSKAAALAAAGFLGGLAVSAEAAAQPESAAKRDPIMAQANQRLVKFVENLKKAGVKPTQVNLNGKPENLYAVSIQGEIGGQLVFFDYAAWLPDGKKIPDKAGIWAGASPELYNYEDEAIFVWSITRSAKTQTIICCQTGI
jgi:hypothetical protein